MALHPFIHRDVHRVHLSGQSGSRLFRRLIRRHSDLRERHAHPLHRGGTDLNEQIFRFLIPFRIQDTHPADMQDAPCGGKLLHHLGQGGDTRKILMSLQPGS